MSNKAPDMEEIIKNIKIPLNCKINVYTYEPIVKEYLAGRLDGNYNSKYNSMKLIYSV